MEILIKILQLILSLSLLVFVHELGHYLSARMFGIRVDKFYIFMDIGGVSLFKFRIGETTFGIGWLPLGGYCKIAGMVDESLDMESLKEPPKPWEFRSKPAWQRLIVMVSGVVMNVVAACVIYIGMSLHWGDSYIDNGDLRWGYAFNSLGHEVGFRDGDRVVDFDGQPVTGNFARVYPDMVMGGVKRVGVMRAGLPDSLGEAGADHLTEVVIPDDNVPEMLNSTDFMMPRVPFVVAGIPDGTFTDLAVGDSLVALDGVSMAFLDQYQRALDDAAGSSVELTVMRDSLGVAVPRTVTARVSDEGMLGVGIKNIAAYFPVHTTEYNFWQAIPAGFRKTGTEISSYWQQLKMIFSPRTQAYRSVGSLITIGSIFPGQWEWYSFWRITAFLSIILAVLNILPIPVLDGGHTLFLLWEVASGRRPSDKFLERAQMVGMAILLALLIFAFGNDIYRFFIK
jgi:regulator of sigma E protease